MEVVRRGRGERGGRFIWAHPLPWESAHSRVKWSDLKAECLREGDLSHPSSLRRVYNQDAGSVMNAQLWNHQGPRGSVPRSSCRQATWEPEQLGEQEMREWRLPWKPYISSSWTASRTRPVPLSLGGFSGQCWKWALTLFASWEDCLTGRWTHLPAESKTLGLDPSAATD